MSALFTALSALEHNGKHRMNYDSLCNVENRELFCTAYSYTLSEELSLSVAISLSLSVVVVCM